MTTLVTAMNDQARTANGALTNASSLNKNLDLFFMIGSSRNVDISPAFMEAMGEDVDTTIRILLWARDVRGGAGERDTFRKLFNGLVKLNPGLASRVLNRIPELGRWDDVLVAFGTSLEADAANMIQSALHSGDGLCAKWMPRKGPLANSLRKHMNLTPKEYRKMLVALSKTVEQQMCSQQWKDINYEQVPSVASGRYQQAFNRHDPVGYQAYVSKLESGEAKINAGAIFPHDVIKGAQYGVASAAEQQWAALPNYLEGSEERILPMVDVSGSMWCPAGGTSTSCLDVAVSLGLYLSERNVGVFKDTFLTFSETPEMVTVRGTLTQKLSIMKKSSWGMNTNIHRAFKTVLSAAVKHGVPAEFMPTMVLILSDMEFDRCGSRTMELPSMQMIEDKYAQSGYTMPKVVFWNLNARPGNVPTTQHKNGAALVSGFSPSIMTSLLSGEDFSPFSVMMETVNKSRYDY